MKDMILTKTRIQAGSYEGVLKGVGTTPPDLALLLLGTEVGTISVSPDPTAHQTWHVRCKLSADLLGDGVQTFLIVDRPTGTMLDSISIITGEPLDDDLRAEMNLLRAELDMLKKAFRRHCTESQ